MTKVLWGMSDCLWYNEGMEDERVEGERVEDEGWRIRGWRVRGRGSGWKVRRWRVRGYEVVRVGRLPMLKITHTFFALMRRYSLPVSLPPAHIFTWLLVAVLP